MFKRKRPQPTESAAGRSRCKLCGTDVDLDSSGRCRLGHRVSDPVAVMSPFEELSHDLPQDSADHADDAGLAEYAELDDAAEDGERADLAEHADHVDDSQVPQPSAQVEEQAGEPEEADDAPVAAIDASRERLLEAASWFSVDDNS